MVRIKYERGEAVKGLIFLEEVEPHVFIGSNASKRKALFLCGCGNEFTTLIYSVKSGRTQSCGCIQRATARKANTTHGLTQSPLYKIWIAMRSRCDCINNKNYHRYGGRGITICNEWKNDFKSFYDWCIDNGYKKGLQIDREDNNGNYEPCNCRFVTPVINTRNSTATKLTKYDVYKIKKIIKSSNKSMKSIAKDFNVTRETIYSIRAGRNWKDIQI